MNLTNRETQILEMLGYFSEKEIAYKLHISVNTVTTHIQKVTRKIEAEKGQRPTKPALVRIYLELKSKNKINKIIKPNKLTTQEAFF